MKLSVHRSGKVYVARARRLATVNQLVSGIIFLAVQILVSTSR
jgi:hypothetical protein